MYFNQQILRFYFKVQKFLQHTTTCTLNIKNKKQMCTPFELNAAIFQILSKSKPLIFNLKAHTHFLHDIDADSWCRSTLYNIRCKKFAVRVYTRRTPSSLLYWYWTYHWLCVSIQIYSSVYTSHLHFLLNHYIYNNKIETKF